jgi:hypothetical protein
VSTAPRSTSLLPLPCCACDSQISSHETKVKGVAAPPNTSGMARCTSGQSLVSSGFALTSSPTSYVTGSSVYADYAAGARKWKVTAAFEYVPAKLATLAYCQRGATVKVGSKSSAPIPPYGDGSATARCHKGETLLSGGYLTSPKPDINNTGGPQISSPTSPTGRRAHLGRKCAQLQRSLRENHRLRVLRVLNDRRGLGDD